MHLDQTPKKAGTEKESRGPSKISSNKNFIKEEFCFHLVIENYLNSPSSSSAAFDVESIEKINSDAETETQTISLS